MLVEPAPLSLAVHRSKDGFAWHCLEVIVNGELLARVRSGGVESSALPSGAQSFVFRLAEYVFGPVDFHVEPGDLIAIKCEMNRPPLHPWHVHAVWFLFLFSVLMGLGEIVPALGVFAREHLAVGVLVSASLGGLGVVAYFRKVVRSGALRGTRMRLDVRSEIQGQIFSGAIPPNPSWRGARSDG